MTRGFAPFGLAFGLSLVLPAVEGCGPPRPPAAIPDAISTAAPAGEEPLPAADAMDFLEKCLEHYDRQGIQTYRLTMQKQERIDGRLEPPEVIEIRFRAQPYSVFMRWLQGARRADRALYVEGENGGQVLVHPTGLAGRIVGVVAIDPEGARARLAGRHSIKEFGLREMLEHTLRDWKAARGRGEPRAEYLGVRTLGPAGDRPCYTLRHTLGRPDGEGVTEATVSIDKETWFQVGTVQRGEGGTLLGEYFYRDIQLNPEFKPDQFERSALTVG